MLTDRDGPDLSRKCICGAVYYAHSWSFADMVGTVVMVRQSDGGWRSSTSFKTASEVMTDVLKRV
jgi:hypothetical protein